MRRTTREFTDEEKEFIESNYREMKYCLIAKQLGREKQEINMFLHRRVLAKTKSVKRVGFMEGYFNVDLKENWVV